eukprot:NODE_731_length_1232_cov_309.337557_g691_i0.p1 GENE.NODE_731_length_1232_cov_309.337557_g691_i0~~NODE_731_length_1232_cov_309.337557_g691_i0.p1  ORF type:complete len:307 (+),score=42.64 NODE_731_length_1232_cov_309.337557_g691_i0:83-1003(+)
MADQVANCDVSETPLKLATAYGGNRGDRSSRHPSSYLFSRKNLLDFDQKLEDGFYDCGRSVSLPTLDYLKAQEPHSGREVILVDRNTDAAFAEMVAKTQHNIDVAKDIRSKVVLLSLSVSNFFGGTNASLISNTEKGILDLKVKKSSNILPLGELQYGVCRHRALAFKYICDLEEIPCRLVRGDYFSEKGTEGHAWNIVFIENRHYLVDIMHDPGCLYDEGSEKADHYKRVTRETGELRYAGGAGMASIVCPPQVKGLSLENKGMDPDMESLMRLVKLLREECAIKDVQIDSLVHQLLDQDPLTAM